MTAPPAPRALLAADEPVPAPQPCVHIQDLAQGVEPAGQEAEESTGNERFAYEDDEQPAGVLRAAEPGVRLRPGGVPGEGEEREEDRRGRLRWRRRGWSRRLRAGRAGRLGGVRGAGTPRAAGPSPSRWFRYKTFLFVPFLVVVTRGPETFPERLGVHGH